MEIKVKTIAITTLLVILSASLTANYFLYKQTQAKTLQVEPIELARMR